jgi:hypothetical protein
MATELVSFENLLEASGQIGGAEGSSNVTDVLAKCEIYKPVSELISSNNLTPYSSPTEILTSRCSLWCNRIG